MFKFELDQLIYYIRNDQLCSAPVISRAIVENLREPRSQDTADTVKLYSPFGKSVRAYATVHGTVLEAKAFASRQDLVNSLLDDFS